MLRIVCVSVLSAFFGVPSVSAARPAEDQAATTAGDKQKQAIVLEVDRIVVADVEIVGTPDQRVLVRRRVVTRDEEGEDADAPSWIGIHITDVPPAVAAQLGLDDAGLMVLNVAKGSPAAQAGLLRYDVLLRFDDRSISPDDREFAELVGATGVGKTVAIELVRKGKGRTVKLKLSPRPERDEIEYRYERDPDLFGEDEMRLRAKMLFKGPEGLWELKDFGDLPKLPDAFRKMLPGLRVFRGNVSVRRHDDGVEVQISVKEDGRQIEIHRRNDGTIEVKKSRKDEGGAEESVQRYNNEDDLRQEDPEAHALLQDVRREKIGVHIEVPHLKFRFDRDLPERLRERTAEWQNQVQKKMKEAQRDLTKAQRRVADELAEHAQRLRLAEELAGHKQWQPFRQWRFFNRRDVTRPLARDGDGVRFSQDEQGRIEVQIRKGADELSMTFKNEAELKAKRPKLYGRYRSLQDDIEGHDDAHDHEEKEHDHDGKDHDHDE